MGASVGTPRPPTGAVVWFAFMIASWLICGVLVMTAGDALADLWEWVRELPLVLEAVAWLLTLPWMLALAVWESGWSDAARVVGVLAIAVAWTLLSIPRPTKP